MKNFLKENLWIMYLGGILAVYDLPFTTWGFWIIIVPTIILVAWSKVKDE